MSKNTSKKVALVTGASRGIGKAIAKELIAAGFTVIGTATSDAGAEQITNNFTEAGANGCGVKLDLQSDSSIKDALKFINDTYGSPAVLINNAGMTSDNLFMRMKDDEWHRVIDANLNGIYRVTKECVRPMLKERWGRIINISSIVAISGNAGQTNYAAAKAGVIAFTKSLAIELGSRGITANVVAPGFIDTDMTSVLNQDHKDNFIKQIPLGRMGTPAEIAGVVKFLVSDDASYITGETINVNGGMLMC